MFLHLSYALDAPIQIGAEGEMELSCAGVKFEGQGPAV
jgi:hypothetical protein